MIVWRGKGILVFLIAILGIMAGTPLALGLAGVIGLTEDKTTMASLVAGLLVAAVGNYYFARYLDDPAKQRTLVDPQTNQTFVFRDGSSLMFIPVRFWTHIFIGLALLTLALAIAGKGPAPHASTPTRMSAAQGRDAAPATPRLRA